MLSAEDQAQSVEKVTLIVKRDHLQQFASTQVSRRLSMGGRSAAVDGDAKAMKRMMLEVFPETVRIWMEVMEAGK